MKILAFKTFALASYVTLASHCIRQIRYLYMLKLKYKIYKTNHDN